MARGTGRRLGQGAFGTVTLHEIGTERYAAKTVQIDRSYESREAETCTFLMKNPCRNVVHIFEVHVGDALVITMEVIRYSLHDVLQRMDKAALRIKEDRAMAIICDIATGLQHLHHHGITHRDIKPQNVLTDTIANVSKICDFGSAKCLTANNTPYITTRFYRAPELILDRNYTDSVDIWALGCVAAEVCGISPLFQGDSNVGQLCAIIRLIGTPTTEDMRCLDSTGELETQAFTKHKKRPISSALQKQMPNGRRIMLSYGAPYESLLGRMLPWAPSKRPSATEVMSIMGNWVSWQTTPGNAQKQA